MFIVGFYIIIVIIIIINSKDKLQNLELCHENVYS